MAPVSVNHPILGEVVTNIAAHKEPESRRHGRAHANSGDSAKSSGVRFAGLFGRRDGLNRSPGWRIEAPAEFEFGRMLTSLDDRFTVLRAFNIFGDLDADFVVVGPPGIFLLTTRVQSNAKVWVDEAVLWVNGHPTNQVRDCRTAADRASARLSTAIGQAIRATPIIAVMDPHSLSFGGDPAQRVVTLPADLVTQWLSDCSRTLSDDTVASFAMVAEDRATWGLPPNGSGLLDRVR